MRNQVPAAKLRPGDWHQRVSEASGHPKWDPHPGHLGELVRGAASPCQAQPLGYPVTVASVRQVLSSICIKRTCLCWPQGEAMVEQPSPYSSEEVRERPQGQTLPHQMLWKAAPEPAPDTGLPSQRLPSWCQASPWTDVENPHPPSCRPASPGACPALPQQGHGQCSAENVSPQSEGARGLPGQTAASPARSGLSRRRPQERWAPRRAPGLGRTASGTAAGRAGGVSTT